MKKIDAACTARRDESFVIVARTDALAIEVTSDAGKRAKSMRLPARIFFPDAVKTADEIKQTVDAAAIPVTGASYKSSHPNCSTHRTWRPTRQPSSNTSCGRNRRHGKCIEDHEGCHNLASPHIDPIFW